MFFSLSLRPWLQPEVYAITGRAFYIIISGNKTRPSSWLFIFSARSILLRCERLVYNILSTHCMCPFFPRYIVAIFNSFSVMPIHQKCSLSCSNAPPVSAEKSCDSLCAPIHEKERERGQIIILDLLVRECNLILKSNFLLNTLRSVFVVIPAPVLGATHFAFTNLNGHRRERVTRWQAAHSGWQK